MSVVNKDGSVGWTRREVTTLACPRATQSKGVRSDSAIAGGVSTTNKKAQISVDQPQSSTQKNEAGADRLLDKQL